MLQKPLLCYCFILLGSLNVFAQSKIALEHNGASSFFNDIPTAVAAAASGDIIYLPGGIFPGFDIDKTLTIIGAGHNPDSTAVTTMTVIAGTITMSNADCDGSLFTGLRVINIVSNLNDNDNVQVSRCFISGSIQGLNMNLPDPPIASSENWTITECFAGRINYLQNSYVSNNLIGNDIYSILNCQIENNIFLNDFAPFNGYSNFCTVKNNVFKFFALGNFHANILNSLFYNNIWSGGNLPNGQFADGNSGINNINDTDFDGLFTNFSYSTYNGNINNLYPFDFSLINTAYNTGGTNGTPIGIYGGISPWKPGSVPFNPHINLKVIAPTTNNTGNLPVQIRVRAQNN